MLELLFDLSCNFCAGASGDLGGGGERQGGEVGAGEGGSYMCLVV